MKSLLASCLVLMIHSCSEKKRLLISSYSSWPDSLIITCSYSGGMVNESSSVLISKDSCVFNSHRDKLDNQYRFKPVQKNLDSLLDKLKTQSVDALREIQLKGTVYDAPGVQIGISTGYYTNNLYEGGTEEVAGLQPTDFRDCWQLINGFAAAGIASQKRNACFTLDASLKKIKAEFSLIPMGEGEAYSESTFKLKPGICMQLLKGKHAFQLHLTRQDPTIGIRYLASAYPVLDIERDTVVRVMMGNDSVIVVK